MKWRKKYKQVHDLDLFILWADGERVTDKYLTGQEVVALVIKLASEGYEDIGVEKVLNG